MMNIDFTPLEMEQNKYDIPGVYSDWIIESLIEKGLIKNIKRKKVGILSEGSKTFSPIYWFEYTFTYNGVKFKGKEESYYKAKNGMRNYTYRNVYGILTNNQPIKKKR